MSKKKWMSSLLAAALAFTTVFSTGSAVKADGNNTSADKITVFVAAEGKDAAGNEVNTGKLPVQVEEGSTADVALKEALSSRNISCDIVESSWGPYLNGIGSITAPADYTKGYWSFYVNGDYSQYGIGQTVLKDNDKISFIFAYGNYATATGAALFNMECTVYMGAEDIERQRLNVFRMEMLGAKVCPVTTGSSTLKDATNEAIRTWAERAEDTFYIIGSAVGPHPYPKMVKEFQKIISVEAKKQILEKEGRLPDVVTACVGGGSNSIGMFADFIDEPSVRLVGVEAGGLGVETGKHASAMALGKVGVLHGMKTYLLQDDNGNIELAHSISAGLDYPGVGPEHANLYKTGRAEYVPVTDDEAVDAFEYLSRTEGIIPAIESAHAVAYARKIVPQMRKDQIVVITISGRGDKDCAAIARYRGEDIHE